MHTITIPLLRPGLLAAWMLLFIASVRELGASILLMGPHSQVLTPAMALIQTFVLGMVVALFMLITRRASRQGG
jgi:iron(III) transport system permease protein